MVEKTCPGQWWGDGDGERLETENLWKGKSRMCCNRLDRESERDEPRLALDLVHGLSRFIAHLYTFEY